MYPPKGFGVGWFDLTESASLGELTGAVLDGGRSPDWGVMTWDVEVPEGASLTVQVRSSKSLKNMGDFVTVPHSGADISSHVNPDAQYLQYRLVLEGSPSAGSPVVRRVGLNVVSLAGPEPGSAGEMNVLKAAGAEPGGRVWFAYGLAPGSSGVPGCPEAQSGLDAPSLVGSAKADEDGTAEVEFLVPDAAAGHTVLFQAMERESCTLSNWRAATFQ